MQQQTVPQAKTRLITRRSHGQIISVIPSDQNSHLRHELRTLEYNFSTVCDCEEFRATGKCDHIEFGEWLAREYAASHPARQTRREPRAAINDPDPFVALVEGI